MVNDTTAQDISGFPEQKWEGAPPPPAHLLAMNPDKALAGWMGRGGLADTGLDSGSAA